jgi:hypothetical protein
MSTHELRIYQQLVFGYIEYFCEVLAEDEDEDEDKKNKNDAI